MADDPKPDDPFDLERFVVAQAGHWQDACRELSAGRKQSHWMWFMFPQMRGLGASAASHHYGIASIDEARAYLAHPVLGPRLNELTRIILENRGRSLTEILGSPDDMKFRSSMTLFARAAGPGSAFAEALDALCCGRPDERTLALLGEA